MSASGITTSVALLMDGFLVVDLSYARAMCAGMTLAEGGDIAGLWPFFFCHGCSLDGCVARH